MEPFDIQEHATQSLGIRERTDTLGSGTQDTERCIRSSVPVVPYFTAHRKVLSVMYPTASLSNEVFGVLVYGSTKERSPPSTYTVEVTRCMYGL